MIKSTMKQGAIKCQPNLPTFNGERKSSNISEENYRRHGFSKHLISPLCGPLNWITSIPWITDPFIHSVTSLIAHISIHYL